MTRPTNVFSAATPKLFGSARIGEPTVPFARPVLPTPPPELKGEERHSSKSTVRSAEILRPRESLPIDSNRLAANGQRFKAGDALQSRVSSRMVAADGRRRILARKTLPPRYLGGYGSCDDS